MAIERLDHVSILAKDPEAVLAFYCEFLGFEALPQRALPAMGMIIHDLKAREGDFIEVIAPVGEGGQRDGIKHLAFLSNDIEADLAVFREGGAKLLHQEVQRHGDVAFFFARSPTGEYVEIIQYF